jgi:hypothetical protein
MDELRNEILLRLLKILAAAIVAALIYLLAVGPLGVRPSFEIAALCWISAAAGLLLVESSPI